MAVRVLLAALGSALAAANDTKIPLWNQTDVRFDLDWVTQRLTKDGVFWRRLPVGSGNWTSTLTGSGVFAQAVTNFVIQTGTTNPSDCHIRSGTGMGLSAGKSKLVINWSKPIAFRIDAAKNGSNAAHKTRLYLGADASNGVGDPAHRSIGFRFDNLAVKGIVHDGTVLTVVDLSTTLTADEPGQFLAVSDGAGNVEFFIDGTSAGSTASGPTGDGTSSDSNVAVEAENLSTTSNQIDVFRVDVFGEL